MCCALTLLLHWESYGMNSCIILLCVATPVLVHSNVKFLNFVTRISNLYTIHKIILGFTETRRGGKVLKAKPNHAITWSDIGTPV